MALRSRDAPYSAGGFGGWAPKGSGYGLSFNGGNPPTVLVEDEGGTAAALAGGLVESITRTGTGVYDVQLTSDFKIVRAYASTESATNGATITAIVDGSAGKAKITVMTYNLGTGAAADDTASIHLWCHLVRATRIKG